jgi:hypothetical protein
MTAKHLLIAGFALVAFTAAPASASACCEMQEGESCCKDKAMTCCKHDGHEMTAADVLRSLDPDAIRSAEPRSPARQTAVVWFHRPVWVGNKVFMGKYVIEHDNDRQARGEPCTHIYAADDLKSPVAGFHCVHLDRARADRDTVVLRTRGDGMRQLLEFQFGGETAGHGYPTGR